MLKTVIISDARRFSLQGVQREPLVETDDLSISLLCFEAGQRDEESRFEQGVVYEVREGEVLIRQGGDRVRLGEGRLLIVPAGQAHTLENAGGGLLVIVATQSR
ncbi:MAG: cupin domain-containing protein [Truepera sp.]|nr:cupin domain-containing protein [Truepera sp.]